MQAQHPEHRKDNNRLRRPSGREESLPTHHASLAHGSYPLPHAPKALVFWIISHISDGGGGGGVAYDPDPNSGLRQCKLNSACKELGLTGDCW